MLPSESANPIGALLRPRTIFSSLILQDDSDLVTMKSSIARSRRYGLSYFDDLWQLFWSGTPLARKVGFGGEPTLVPVSVRQTPGI